MILDLVDNLQKILESSLLSYQNRLDFFTSHNLNSDDFTMIVGCKKRIKLPLKNAKNRLVSAHDVMRLAQLDRDADLDNQRILSALDDIDNHLQTFPIFSNQEHAHCFIMIHANYGTMVKFELGFFYGDVINEKLNIDRMKQRMITFDKNILFNLLQAGERLCVNEAMMAKDEGVDIETWVACLTRSGIMHSFITKAHNLESCILFLALTQCTAIIVPHYEVSVSYTPKRIHSFQKELFRAS